MLRIQEGENPLFPHPVSRMDGLMSSFPMLPEMSYGETF